jgi:hypothetical protein
MDPSRDNFCSGTDRGREYGTPIFPLFVNGKEWEEKEWLWNLIFEKIKVLFFQFFHFLTSVSSHSSLFNLIFFPFFLFLTSYLIFLIPDRAKIYVKSLECFDTTSNVVFNMESEKEKREKAADNMIVIAKAGHTSAAVNL